MIKYILIGAGLIAVLITASVNVGMGLRASEVTRLQSMIKAQAPDLDLVFRACIPAEYRDTCDVIHHTMGFKYRLIYWLVLTESNWVPNATHWNTDGSYDHGLCQLNSGNFTYYAPQDNLLVGFGYLKKLVDRFGSLESGLLAYNGGPGRLMRGTTPKSTYEYVMKVMK